MQGGGAAQRHNGNNSNNSGSSKGIGGGGSGGGGGVGDGGGSYDASRPTPNNRVSPPRSISNGYGSGSSSNNSISNGTYGNTNGNNGKGKDTHRRNFREEGLELSRSAWRQEKTAAGWVREETSGHGHAMGGANSKAKGEGGYEVVEREESLLDGEVDGAAANLGESMSASLLLNTGDSPTQRSGGDSSFGPAFGRHEGNAELSDGGKARGRTRMRSGGGGGGGGEAESWAISGRPLVYLCAACSSLCSILLGYDVGVMSGAKEYIEPDLGLTTVQNEVMVGSLNIVAAFGGLLAGKTADRLGRKPTTALACTVFIIGATMMSISHSFWFLLLGRIVTGVGVGCAMVIAPVYITELAPPDIRGMLVSLTDICINVGIVLGYASSLLCSNIFHTASAKWRSMIGIGMLPPIFILGCLALMPESPRWLISKGKNADALVVLKRVLGDHQEAEESLHTISEATSTQEATWRDILLPKDRVVRAAMILGVGLGFWQQASGSEAAVYYTPEVLRSKGWADADILKGNMGVGGFKLLGEVVAFMLLDRIGRRPLFLVSSVLVTFCLAMVGNAFLLDWSSMLTLLWLCMFMFTFSLGLGPVTFVVASEIFPVAVRGKAMSVVICVNRLMSGVIALSYQSVSEAMTPGGSFYFFAALSFISVAFYYYTVPETRGKTLEEIAADLGSSSPPDLPGPRGSVNGSGMGGPRHVPLADAEQEDFCDADTVM